MALTLLLAQAALPQAPSGQITGRIQWIRQFGTATVDEAFGIAVDTTGVYVTGFTIGALPGQTSVGSSDAFVRKYDADGSELWTRQFGSAGSDKAEAVAADGSGVYVVGRGSDDAMVRKFDASGNEIWSRRFGGDRAFVDSALTVAVDPSGVYVGGWVYGALPGQVTSNSSFDAFVRRYDFDGNEIWTRQFGSEGGNYANAVAVDPSGVYVAGFTYGVLPEQIADGRDAYVRKYDLNGSELWTRQFGSIHQDIAFALALDATGVYVAGSTDFALPGQTRAGSTDSFVRKYDSSGVELWTRQFGSPGGDQANAIFVDGSGVYVAGFAVGNLPGQIGDDSADAFVRKYDSSGAELWTRQFGIGAQAQAEGIAVDGSGIYLAGSVFGALPGQTSAGSWDAFVTKLVEVEVTPVTIDIKPGEFPNTIKLGSNGTVPVAILSTPEFDATTVDPLTVSLAGAQVAIRGKGTIQSSILDVNSDGLADLLVHVTTEALQLSDSDTQAVLSAETFAGEVIQGTDSVRVVP